MLFRLGMESSDVIAQYHMLGMPVFSLIMGNCVLATLESSGNSLEIYIIQDQGPD